MTKYFLKRAKWLVAPLLIVCLLWLPNSSFAQRTEDDYGNGVENCSPRADGICGSNASAITSISLWGGFLTFMGYMLYKDYKEFKANQNLVIEVDNAYDSLPACKGMCKKASTVKGSEYAVKLVKVTLDVYEGVSTGKKGKRNKDYSFEATSSNDKDDILEKLRDETVDRVPPGAEVDPVPSGNSGYHDPRKNLPVNSTNVTGALLAEYIAEGRYDELIKAAKNKNQHFSQQSGCENQEGCQCMFAETPTLIKTDTLFFKETKTVKHFKDRNFPADHDNPDVSTLREYKKNLLDHFKWDNRRGNEYRITLDYAVTGDIAYYKGLCAAPALRIPPKSNF